MRKKTIGIAALAGIVVAGTASFAAADRDHLQCFKIKDGAGKLTYTADLTAGNAAFAAVSPGCSIKLPAKLLCIDVASSDAVPSPPGSPDGAPAQEYLCYKSTCDKQSVTVEAKDRFGTRMVSASSTGLVCAPVDVAAGSSDRTWVISAVDLPADTLEAEALGFDLDGSPGVDNRFGDFLVSISTLAASIDQQAAIDQAIDRGEVVMLANLRSGSLVDADVARFSTWAGSTAVTPPACTDSSDVVCRHHLDGTGTFAIDSSSPTDSSVRGKIVSGKFNGGPGAVTLQLFLFGLPVTLPLELAQASITGLTSDGWTDPGSKIGGAIAKDDLDSAILPAFGNFVRSAFALDCAVGGTPPGCGCTSGSTGATLRNLFDKAPTQDCTISDTEVQSVYSAFVVPDIDLDGDGTDDAVSIGIGVKAVKATFTVP